MIGSGPGTTKRSIALIGLRGSGKSTVGRELASLLDGDHPDTDELIVQRGGKSIAAIFAEEGEAGFRAHERRAIEEVTSAPPRVLSVGGGAVLDPANVASLEAVATLVWLTAEPEILWQRICSDPSTAESRPALTDRTGVSEMEQLLAERQATYAATAQIVVDTTREAPAELARIIVRRVRSAHHH